MIFTVSSQYNTQHTDTELEEQWRLPRYRFPSWRPDVQLNRFHTPSLFLGSSECEEKWSKSTCDSWMISNLSSKHLYRSISRTHSDNFLGRELCMKWVSLKWPDVTIISSFVTPTWPSNSTISLSSSRNHWWSKQHQDNIQWQEPDYTTCYGPHQNW